MGEGAHGLVIAGHGSLKNPDSSRPAVAHAHRIRSLGLFDEVRTTFWKEEPAFRDVLRTVECDRITVVPLFMASGYFVDRILPREMRLTTGTNLDVDADVRVSKPVGTHPAMRDVILHRAETAVRAHEHDAELALVVVGHGTERHEESGTSTYAHVERLRALNRFSAVHALFMDESPNIAAIETHVAADAVVIVPLFVADGYHTQEDIPRILQLESTPDEQIQQPSLVNGQQRWYTEAVGTDPRMVTVILERAMEAGAPLDPATITEVA